MGEQYYSFGGLQAKQPPAWTHPEHRIRRGLLFRHTQLGSLCGQQTLCTCLYQGPVTGTGMAATVVSPGTTRMRAYQAPGSLSVEQIAALAYRASQKGKTAAIPGLFNRILAFLGELPPRAMAFEVFAFLSQEKG
jgi:short-subunit dehydrogenase